MTERKQRLFIYDRREMLVLMLLALAVAVFAFTLGVHLGKRVGLKLPTPPAEITTVGTVNDKVPNRQEIVEQAKGAEQAADEALSQALHDEVAKTGVKLDGARQVDLPKNTHGKTPEHGNAQATEEGHPAEETVAHQTSAEHAAPEHAAADHSAPKQHETHAEPVKSAHHEQPAQNAQHEQAPQHAEAAHATELPKHVKTVEHSKTAHEKYAAVEGKSAERATEHAVAEDAPAEHESAKAPKGKFTLQVGSYASEDEAAERVATLQGMGYKTFVRPADIKGRGKWFRLYIGDYSSREAAEKAGALYRTQGVVQSYIVSKMPE